MNMGGLIEGVYVTFSSSFVLTFKALCVAINYLHLRIRSESKDRLIFGIEMGHLLLFPSFLPLDNEEETAAAKDTQPSLWELLSISDLECSLCIR